MVRVELAACTRYADYAENECVDPAIATAETMTPTDYGGNNKGGDVDDEFDHRDPTASVVHFRRLRLKFGAWECWSEAEVVCSRRNDRILERSGSGIFKGGMILAVEVLDDFVMT